MCKIAVLTNTSKIKDIKKAIKVISKQVTLTENDGVGYAIQGVNGVFGEKSIETSNFESSFDKKVLKLPFSSNYYDKFGTWSKPKGAGIFHGRTSTNDRNITNTHPLQKNNWTLIHNGVVSNHGPKYDMMTTNDTEHLLHYMSTSTIQDIEKYITGYYAFAAIDPKGQLHIVKDNIASLNVAFIDEIDSYIFATTNEIINSVCKEMKWTSSQPDYVNDNIHLVFNGNIVVSQNDIKPRGRTNVESQFASLSLGRTLEPSTSELSFGSDDKYEQYADKWMTKGYSDDEVQFLQEVTFHADSSYMFLDYKGNEMSLDEFSSLSDDEKLYCTVVRSDGTIVDQAGYDRERLYG